MYGIEDQIEGIKMLDRAYACYLKEGDFQYTDEMYEKAYAFILFAAGIKKLTQIYYATSGTKQVTRKAQIKYIFDEIFKQ